jgi:hypothetical protein
MSGPLVWLAKRFNRHEAIKDCITVSAPSVVRLARKHRRLYSCALHKHNKSRCGVSARLGIKEKDFIAIQRFAKRLTHQPVLETAVLCLLSGSRLLRTAVELGRKVDNTQ